jgi:serine/threonine protein kinase
MSINVERLLRESPIPIDPKSVEAVHEQVFKRPRRSKPDHYELHEELGRGQFGRVHRATDTRFPREVALKLIDYRGSRQLARLEREARALAKLSHPNIVTIFEKGIVDAGHYYLATELVPGARLDTWMADPSRSLREILEVFAQAAEGLHHAHQRGLIHRDFKPSNAIVDQSGRLRILDFGLAKLVTDDGADSHNGASATLPSGRPPLSLGPRARARHLRGGATSLARAVGRRKASHSSPTVRSSARHATPHLSSSAGERWIRAATSSACVSRYSRPATGSTRSRGARRSRSSSTPRPRRSNGGDPGTKSPRGSKRC